MPAAYWELKTSGEDAAQWRTHKSPTEEISPKSRGKNFNTNIKAAISYLDRLVAMGRQPEAFLPALEAAMGACSLPMSQMCAAMDMLQKGKDGFVDGKSAKRPLSAIRDVLARQYVLVRCNYFRFGM